MSTSAILSADEAAALMRCSVKTIEEHARAGTIPGLLWGNSGWVFPADAFYARLNELALENMATRSAPPAAPTAVLFNHRTGTTRRAPPALPSLEARQ